MMLFQNKSTNQKKYLYLSVLPLVGVVVFSTLLFNTSKAKTVVKDLENKVEDVKLLVSNGEDENLLLAHNNVQEDTTKNRRNNKQDANSSDLIFSETEILALPPGGMTAFRKWIAENYQFPQAAINAGIKGTLEVSFIVEKDGSLSDFRMEKDLGYNTGEAAIELMKISPKWSPAIQNGREVRVAFTLPIRLDLTSEVKGRRKYQNW